MEPAITTRLWRSLPWLAAFLLFTWPFASGFAQQAAEEAADPPARVANLSHREGGVVFAPEGDEEWTDLPQNRPLTVGDRLWSDQDARAELHLGSATLHIDGESHLGIAALDADAAQFILMQGSVNARVRELAAGENFEIDTPNLALRATQPGDYRIDVDAGGGQTRVIVMSGMATVFGEGGDAVHLGAGQQATFAGRALARVDGPAYRPDAFAQWAAERNRAEDQSVAARHVPRGVVGYAQLDQHGTWGQDATHGTVWYPRVADQDWAPYRQGRWDYVQPWGWTWVDDAPWGFAPFHYGRWAQIGSRWAWVPGQLATRPVYSPALVVFLGGGNGFNVAGGPGVGWYPLAPGEAWYPGYRTTPRYLAWANHRIDLNRYPRHFANHFYRHRPHAFTAARMDDFRSGRPLRHAWRSLQHASFAGAQVGAIPDRPDRNRFDRQRPRLNAAPPRMAANLPSRQWNRDFTRGDQRQQRQFVREERREDRREERREVQQPRQREWPGVRQPQRDWAQERAAREQQQQAQRQQQHQREQQRQQWDRAQRDQQRQQWEAQRAAREQQEHRIRFQRENAVREQQRAQQQQQRLQREAERTSREQQRQAWQQQRAQQQQFRQPEFQSRPQRQEAAPIGRSRGADRDDRRGHGEGRGHRGDDNRRWQRGG